MTRSPMQDDLPSQPSSALMQRSNTNGSVTQIAGMALRWPSKWRRRGIMLNHDTLDWQWQLQIQTVSSNL